MNKLRLFIGLLILALFAMPSQAFRTQAVPDSAPLRLNSNVIQAASCSQQHVQAAIDAANDGDFVLIPAGHCTWTTPASQTPSVTINQKSITLQGAGLDQTVITDETGSNWNEVPLKVDGTGEKPWRVTGFTFEGATDNFGVMDASGKNFRIDHIKFGNAHHRSITITGFSYGVIDHCVFVQTSEGDFDAILVRGDDDTAWERPLTLGTAYAVYVEDCLFDLQMNQAAIDAQMGGRLVFRYNTVQNGFPLVHGRDSSGGRSTHSYEIYNNNLTTTFTPYRGVFLRGGTGVVWNNTWTGTYQRPIDLTNYCTCYGQSSGYCAFDRCTQYPCIDQVGRTTGQSLAPLYVWGNTLNGGSANAAVYNFPGCDNPSVYDHIQENRDYYNHPKSGYTPYVYPHPLIKDLILSGIPADRTIHLNWEVKTSVPVTSTWQITYYSQTVPITINNIVSPTRAYDLNDLTNYAWYTVTLNAMLEGAPFLTDTIKLMPTDRLVYLPIVVKEATP